jgi:hypothetical protein
MPSSPLARPVNAYTCLWYFGSCISAVTGSLSGPRKLFKGVIPATSGVLARFPLLLPVRNSFASYGASAVARTSDRGHVAEAINQYRSGGVSIRVSKETFLPSASLQLGTRLTDDDRPCRQAPPPRTHAGVQSPAAHPRRTAHPVRMNCPNTHVSARTQHAPGNKPLCILQPRACDAGNKIAASAHVMGSGGSAVAMVIGRLGVDRHVECFFSYLAIPHGVLPG